MGESRKISLARTRSVCSRADSGSGTRLPTGAVAAMTPALLDLDHNTTLHMLICGEDTSFHFRCVSFLYMLTSAKPGIPSFTCQVCKGRKVMTRAMRTRIRRMLLIGVFVSAVAGAQSGGATILGTVTDPADSIVLGAK